MSRAYEYEIPYFTSPPVQYVYRSTANLVFGAYTWADNPSPLYFPIAGSAGAVLRRVQSRALYYIRDITVKADIDKNDYPAALSAPIPYLSLHLRSQGRTSLFREPFVVPSFLENFQYRQFVHITQDPEEMLGSFRGALIQTPALIGKASITLTAVLSVQEISDHEYVNRFMQGRDR